MKTILFISLMVFNTLLLASNLGKETYEATCKTCHSSSMSMGIHAPAAFDKKEWAMRFEKAATESKNNPTQFKTAMDYLLYKVSIGKGLMPHGGLCKETMRSQDKYCSNEAIADAINYMAGVQQ